MMCQSSYTSNMHNISTPGKQQLISRSLDSILTPGSHTDVWISYRRCSHAVFTGVRIVCEPPLLTLPHTATQTSFAKLIMAFSTTRKDALFQLYDCKRTGNDPPTAEGILATNSFGLGNPGTDAGIFLTTCRLNHSCVPNCSHFWHSDTGLRTVHTSREIKSGEELTLSYISHHIMDWESRQAELEEVYNFICGCEVGGLQCFVFQFRNWST